MFLLQNLQNEWQNVKNSFSINDDSILCCPKSDLLNSVDQDVLDNPKSSKSELESKKFFESMKNERNRFNSFGKKWPLHFISFKDLAESGFFYLQADDRVQCAFCKLIIYNWEIGDKPFKEHKDKSPSCPFFTNNKSESLFQNEPQQSSNYCSEYIPVSSSTSNKPNNPRMSDIRRRLSTFKGWVHSFQNPEDLADCGLYYTGVADVVKCFYCGGALGNWEPLDNPFTEHSKFYPNCTYLRLLQNRPIQRKETVKCSSYIKKDSYPPVKQILAAELLKSDIIRQAKEIFPPNIVDEVLLQHLKQTGQPFTSLNQICEKVLEHDEKKLKFKLNTSDEKLHQHGMISHESNNSSANGVGNIRFLCKICMDKEMSVVFQPCGHLVSCESCTELISECPLCRKPIESTIKTYLS